MLIIAQRERTGIGWVHGDVRLGITTIQLFYQPCLGSRVPLVSVSPRSEHQRKVAARALAGDLMWSGPESSAAGWCGVLTVGETSLDCGSSARVWPLLRAILAKQFVIQGALVVGPAGGASGELLEYVR